MSPDRENRLKTMTVLFAAVVSLFLVRGGHATSHSVAPCTINGTSGPDILVDAQLRIVDEINGRLMARGAKKMAHFLVYNEPNLIPLFYHSLGWYPVERTGPEYLLPAFDMMLSHYIKAYDGIHDLFEERGLGDTQCRVHDREPLCIRIRQAVG